MHNSEPGRKMCLHLGWNSKSILLPASLWLFAALANAQFMPIQHFTLEAPGGKTPVIADIVVRTTSITPWGTSTQVLKGKFWRSRDGRNRQDDSFGTSYLLSLKAQTWIDRELQTATVVPPPVLPTKSKARYADEMGPLLFVPIDSWSRVHASLGKGTLMGRAVQGWQVGSRANDFDVWTDTRLGIPMEIRMKADAAEIVQQLNNVEEREPDPEVFKIPEGFSVLKCTQTASRRPSACSAGR